MENIDYQKQLDEYLLRKLKEQNDPNYGASDRAEMGRIEQNNSDNALASSLMKSAAQMGSIGGKVADTSAVDNMAQGLGKTNQLKLGQIDDRRAREDKQFGMNADVYKYLAEKQRKAEEMAGTKDYQAKTLAQNAELARQKKADEDKRFNADQANKNREFKLKEREISSKELADKTKMAEKDLSKLPYERRVAALGAEERKRFDSASMGHNAVKGMAKSLLEDNENTFSLVGDNNFTLARRDFEEALGRMQSGGAISSDEEARFKSMAPTATDSTEIQKTKLAKLQTEMALRLKNLGFTPDEVDAQRSSLATEMPKSGDGTAIANDKLKKTPEDDAALDWARSNPNDPRAKEILRLNGGQ